MRLSCVTSWVLPGKAETVPVALAQVSRFRLWENPIVLLAAPALSYFVLCCARPGGREVAISR